MNKVISAIVCGFLLGYAGVASALTIKSGQVISNGKVIDASESQNVQNAIANEGYAIAGGALHIEVQGVIVSVDLNEIRGKSREQVVAIIGAQAVEQLSDLHDAAQADVDAIIADGGNAVNAVGLSAEEIQEIIESGVNGDVGAIVGASEAALAEVHAALDIVDSTEAIERHGADVCANGGKAAGDPNCQ